MFVCVNVYVYVYCAYTDAHSKLIVCNFVRVFVSFLTCLN